MTAIDHDMHHSVILDMMASRVIAPKKPVNSNPSLIPLLLALTMRRKGNRHRQFSLTCNTPKNPYQVIFAIHFKKQYAL